MPITWRPAQSRDIEPGLSIQPGYKGDARVGIRDAMEAWARVYRHRFFVSCVLESSGPQQEPRMVGFGATVLVTKEFTDMVLANPQPDINSLLIERICSSKPVLATVDEAAQANASDGVNVLILCGTWRHLTLTPSQLQETQTLSVSSFTQLHAGWRLRTILQEPCGEPEKSFVQGSIEFQSVAKFPEVGRELFQMTRDSVQGIHGSVGNLLFSAREPGLGFRYSDQQLLNAAISGGTDQELASQLSISLAAVKARWRSVIARVEEMKPSLVGDVVGHKVRGAQKRHQVLAYVRTHPEELRPFHSDRLRAH